MTYKNQFAFLLSLIGALSILYIAGFVFSPERKIARSASHVWLDAKLTDRISRMVLRSEGENLELIKENGRWYISHNGIEYPARQLRIEDFIGFFTTRAAWNIRSSNASTHIRFGLDADAASRVMIYGENTLLLDLLLGYVDEAGQIYVRKYGENEVRSGENNIYYYLGGSIKNWFNLRLFTESENGYIDVDDVQRLSVYNNGETQTFSRQNRSWNLVAGVNSIDPDQGIVESYIRNVLNSEGDDFADINFSAPVDFNFSRIVMEFGNGKIMTVRFSAPDNDDRRFARIDGSDYIYSIPAWVSSRLFRDAASFESR